MGVWKVADLDKNKTEQSISNELARLDECKVALELLKREKNAKQRKYREELDEIDNRIAKIESSIDSGAKFVEECIRHLKEFD